ncbi:MAG: sigma-70 family RNA polymerase sigma factor, partial [Fibrobacteres bacterium]|nr:sigma-70 family RNA polymerase sigma factor [Fibrobacterota bacterium]
KSEVYGFAERFLMASELTYSSLADEVLVSLLRRGDIEAFNEIYDRYSQRLFFFICRLLHGDKEYAEDLLQDVFLTLVEHGNMFNTNRKFSTWIFTVTRNKIKNIYRFREGKAFQSIGNESLSLLLNMPNCVEKNIDVDKFTECLKKELSNYSEEEKSTFWLRHQEEFSIKEISQILECPEGTVHSRLHNITKKIAESLTEYKTLLLENENEL